MNRLARESSPYLRQHAGNPVDWYPWGGEAFAKAQSEDKPVLLSVGYSACHWCHVMAHESFEDPDVAKVMNELFVNIKVDREERPDVDAIYMEATQALTGSGGWPMTVFMAPDGRPFYAGTYFPKRAAHGRPGFVDLLHAVNDAWTTKRGDLIEQADQLTAAIEERSAIPQGDADAPPSPDILQRAYEGLRDNYDAQWGGFGRAPKFPMTTNVELLLRSYTRNADTNTLQMVATTLDAMASGGIYDHLGGGFARYSVDTTWTVPHFEKMLYDNALIPRPYVHAWQLTGEPRFRQVVEETLGYVLRDLSAPEGGIYSAEDADSEGVEGKFYVWSADEIDAAIQNAGQTSTAGTAGKPDTADAVRTWYGVTPKGNFEGENILTRPVRGDLIRPPEIEAARQILFERRTHRVRPGLDDKVITEWNAMFAATLAEAGAAMDNAEWVNAAKAIATFLREHLRGPDGRWLRAWHRDAGARNLAYAVDYAHLVDAFTRLAEATGEARWIEEATTTAHSLLDLFWDENDGGVWTTGTDGEQLLVRTKDAYDGATPSANSVAATSLLRLGALTGEARFTDAARAILRMLNRYLTVAPTAVTQAVAAVDMVVNGITEIVVAGDRRDLVAEVHRRYLPNAVLAFGERYDSPLWEGRSDDEKKAYVCRDFVCQLPTTTTEDLSTQLTAAAR